MKTLDRLRNYLNSKPVDELRREFNELGDEFNVGLTISEYIMSVNEQREMLLSGKLKI